jgi:G3E family GTPase
VKDSGVNAIEQLMDRRGAFDYVLLETTGLADPGNIAPIFWVDDGLGSTVYLDGIVTVVDAHNIIKSLEEPAVEEKAEAHENVDGDHHAPGAVMTVAHLQISHADIIILNKTDLVSPLLLESVASRIRSINGIAKIINTTHARVPDLSGTLLDLHAYDGHSTIPDFTAHGHSHLDPSISTLSFPLPPFEPQKLCMLENWLQSLLWDDGTNIKEYEIHRLKGYIPITDGSARLVQGVREIFDIIDVEGGATGQQDEGKIVLIGKGLEHISLGVGT